MKGHPDRSKVSLAILPFESFSLRQEYSYFVDGLVDELITDLSHFSDLQIISSYTSKRLCDEDLDTLTAARRIHIDFLLRGTIHLNKKNLRLTTQLIDTAGGNVVWADKFDGKTEDIFELQDSIVNRVVFKIFDEVGHSILAETRKKPVTSLAAYDCWLRGMECLSHGSIESDNQAREYFNQALSIDPNYSRAYAGLSLSHFNEWSCQIWELYEASQHNAYNYAVKACEREENDHIVQMILGRVYLYRRQFELAEHHIEHSLSLNNSDADNLVQLASCLAYLGRAAEGERLFNTALSLNPFRNLWYYQYGSFVLFVQKRFKESIDLALKRQLTNTWVDLSAYIASAHGHCNDPGLGEHYFQIFLEDFTRCISRGSTPAPQTITDWIKQANPFKFESDLENLFDGLEKAGFSPSDKRFPGRPLQDKVLQPPQLQAIFKQEDVMWRLDYEGTETVLPDLKGLHDIAKLLAQPDSDIHCSELMETESSMDETHFRMDRKALQEYKLRLDAIHHELDEAEDANDLGRKQRLIDERDALLDHLAKNSGIGGKSRKLGSQSERARAAVTLRIRNVIKKIGQTNQSLAKHLSNSIRTGVFCSYSPEEAPEWVLH